jgi:tetratricopeptide (TPR) repeat protein
MVYHSSANYEEAAVCYQLACEKNPDNLTAHYYLGFLDLEKGNTQGAIENFRKVIKRDDTNMLAWYYLGEATRNQSQFTEAMSCFEKIINSGEDRYTPDRENYFPVSTYASFNLGRIYLNEGKINEAEKILRKTISDQITFGPAYRLLGNVYARKGDSLLSRKFTIRAKDYADFTPPADPMIDQLLLISRSDLYLLKGIDQAINNSNYRWTLKLCDEGLNYLPDNNFLISKAIRVYLITGNESRAFTLMEKHASLFEKDFRELMDMADFLMKRGKFKLGLLYFAMAKKLNPLDPALALWLKNWNYNLEAEKLINEQIHKKPEEIQLLANALMISAGNKNRENVVNFLDQIKKLNPSKMEIKKCIGFLAYQDNRLGEAIQNWKEVLKSDPKDVGTIRNLNKIYKQKQLWAASCQLLREGLETNPNDPQLLDEYGKLLVLCPDEKIRNIKEGEEFSERAFYHFYTTYGIKLSAARNLATAYAITGQKQLANKFIDMSMNMVNEKEVNEFQNYYSDLKKNYGF